MPFTTHRGRPTFDRETVLHGRVYSAALLTALRKVKCAGQTLAHEQGHDHA